MSSDRAGSERQADTAYMARAIQLARQGLYSTDPNPRVGCVVVKNGEVIGEGWHQYAGEAHAEVEALASAGNKARGATAYVTLEPCCHFGRTPPCADALINAGIARAVIAGTDPNPQVGGKGTARLEAAGVATTVGVLENEARDLNPGFLRRMRGGQPWVRLKVAASIDGRTAMQSGESKWITGAPARADVQRLRARSSAIITGVGTVLDDDPALTVRPSEMGSLGQSSVPRTQPCRIVLDSTLRTPPGARLLKAGGRTVILCHRSTGADARRAALEAAGAEVIAIPGGAGGSRLSWAAIGEWMQGQGFNEVLIEAGATVSGTVIESGLVDELWLYQAPTLLGSRGRPLAELPFDRMAQQCRLTALSRRQIGVDNRTIFSLRGAVDI